MPFYVETPTTPRRMQTRVSIEDVCEDFERLRSSFEFKDSRASLSLHVAQGWIVPPTIGMEEEMNRTAELVAFLVQADMVHFDADEEILEVEGKIAALEAQSANVHDESNAQKVGKKGAASVPEESSGSQVVSERAAWERVAEAMLEGPRLRKRERRGGFREVTRALKKGTRTMQKTEVDARW